ncbi:uncharacterized protein BT62DRAFT_1003248 [Guyanagaster necrorhizus]|uniref:Uncharacterized protein n=1 Tax=Guyanagaster necrorhizus TaxID=856835 RepID=A0A9P8AUI6_9AGAR|nr:uncharacterized protein BT62DRAFT_1003248 [Guyanagaster necrorhizus MCA 3950]KAG7448534.1 hypothetical protein BT62DRAFT_1003248 [Guyanagaster necrorhizus MCA 3950]
MAGKGKSGELCKRGRIRYNAEMRKDTIKKSEVGRGTTSSRHRPPAVHIRRKAEGGSQLGPSILGHHERPSIRCKRRKCERTMHSQASVGHSSLRLNIVDIKKDPTPFRCICTPDAMPKTASTSHGEHPKQKLNPLLDARKAYKALVSWTSDR